MTCPLTHADRELLLEALDCTEDGWHGSDDELLSAICDWAKELTPGCGFEHSLLRDLTVLSQQLVNRRHEHDIALIARGALQYVLNVDKQGASRLGELGLFGSAFVANYAVHEILTRLGERPTYNPPRPSPSEQQYAEALFLEWAERPLANDTELAKGSREVCAGLATLASCGLFRRLHTNVEFLIATLTSSDSEGEARAFARAALSYLIHPDDAIADRYGIAGYLDDNFVIQLAVDLIQPARDPWLDMLDATVGAWPFLNRIVIDDGGESRPLSEYMIINAALSCPEVRPNGTATVFVVAPSVGPSPFLFGFMASLALLYKAGQRQVDEQSFRIGQKVLVDNNAVAEFAGVSEISGRRVFGLIQHRRHRGHTSPQTRWWPIDDLRRLAPVDDSRATRGSLCHNLGKSEAPLSVLEYLFSTRMPSTWCVDKEVLVVTRVATALDYARHLKIHGQALKDIVPMGHLAGGIVKPLSQPYGWQSPVLVFASDLDAACAYVDDRASFIDLALIDMAGRNAHKTSSLTEMRHSGVRTLVTLSEQTANELALVADETIDLWEWDSRDFDALLWPSSANRSGVIASYEHLLRIRSAATPNVVNVECSAVDELWGSVAALKELTDRRAAEPIAEMQDALSLTFSAMVRLLHLAVPLTDGMHASTVTARAVAHIRQVLEHSRFISEDERHALGTTYLKLDELQTCLRLANPKVAAVQELLRSHPDLMIIATDTGTQADLAMEFAAAVTTPALLNASLDFLHHGPAVITGWLRKDRMSRLLVPPLADPLFLVLYGVEARWHRQFERERKMARMNRHKNRKRGNLFPAVQGWNERRAEPVTDRENDASLRTVESVREHARVLYTQRVCSAAQSDGTETEVEARLVIFEGGMHAFLRDSYRAIVATHLLDPADTAEVDDAEVLRKPAGELRPGDAILFHRQSDRDVIRMSADEDLPSGVRRTASVWQVALRDFARRASLTQEEIWRRLRGAGCPLHRQTIRAWLSDDEMIAPRQYERDIPIIADVTGDPRLLGGIPEILTAVRIVFGAHQRASRRLARQVLARVMEILRHERDQTGLVEVEADIVLASIVEVDSELMRVRSSMVNRLQSGPHEWHE